MGQLVPIKTFHLQSCKPAVLGSVALSRNLHGPDRAIPVRLLKCFDGSLEEAKP